MSSRTIPPLDAPAPRRDHPLTRSVAGMIGFAFLAFMILACIGSLPWTLSSRAGEATPRYNDGEPRAGRLSPMFWPVDDAERLRRNLLVELETRERIAREHDVPVDDVAALAAARDELQRHWNGSLFGTDVLGRDLFTRCLTGGGISLGIGIAAALLSVFIGTMYGAIAAYAGGRVDAVMMRLVDILYGLPYILLVVLLAVAVESLVDHAVAQRVPQAAAARAAYVEERLEALGSDVVDPAIVATLQEEAMARHGTGELGLGVRNAINVITLLVAIGGVSWLTMARVIRGQVLSLKSQPFIEAARSIGVPLPRLFLRHLLPNLLGPIIVYTTLTVPQAILQESFLSFLGIGVKPPLPSWGNLAADGLSELNTYKSNWWLLVFPCVLLGTTLLALNFVGEGLREAFDPRRARR